MNSKSLKLGMFEGHTFEAMTKPNRSFCPKETCFKICWPKIHDTLNMRKIFAILMLFLFLTGFTTQAWADNDNPMPPKGPAPIVEGKIIQPLAPPVFRPNFDPPAPRVHPPIDEIPPMPFPDPEKHPLTPPIQPGAPIFYNPSTNESHILELPPLDETMSLSPSKMDGYAGADGGTAEDDHWPAAFSEDMVKVAALGDFPWRMNVKLVARHEDQDGISRWSSCSGSMIDGATVLTAGHCIYAHEPNGVIINDWARDVWVYPGWDGASTGDLAQTYGMAQNTGLGSWTTWTVDGDLNGDIGIVALDRAVGMLTGWFPTSWDGNLTWIQSKTYHNASYPVESCGLTGLHNGEDMYYWYGEFDSASGPDDRRITINTSGGCFNAVWGGMSGGGAYYRESETRYVHAVSSSSNRSTSATYTKMWGDWATYMNGTFIPTHGRGNTFDLQPLDMNAEPATIKAGSSTTLLNHLATNPTNGSANGTWTYRVYLSTTSTITSADTLLSTQNFSWNFGPMSSARVNMSLVTVPINTPPGNYWIGVIYDSATDARPGNNHTSGWDAVPITVTAPDTGSLEVYIEPLAARDAGARWRLTSGPDTGWKTSDTPITGIPVGNYTVEFSNITGWIKPANASVSINKDVTTSISRTYTRLLPSVVTLEVEKIGQTSAMLRGAVNPNGLGTDAWFQYKEQSGLYKWRSTPKDRVGSGTTEVQVSHAVQDLQCGTDYEFRAVAENFGGIEYGLTMSFITNPCSTTYDLSVNSSGASGVVIDSMTKHGGTTNYKKTALAPSTNVNLIAPAYHGSGKQRKRFSYWSGCVIPKPFNRLDISFSMDSHKICTANYTDDPDITDDGDMVLPGVLMLLLDDEPVLLPPSPPVIE